MVTAKLLIALALSATAQDWVVVTESGLSGGGVVGGDLDMGGNDIVCSALLADNAPSDLLLKACGAYALAATNTTGANVNVVGGHGSKSTVIDDYTLCSTETVILAVVNSDGTEASTTLTEGVEWTAATDNATTCTSLGTAVDAVSGVSADTSACAGSDKLGIVPDASTARVILSESEPTCTTTANGVDGSLWFGSNADLDGHKLFLDVDALGTDTYLEGSAGDIPRMFAGGINTMQWRPTLVRLGVYLDLSSKTLADDGDGVVTIKVGDKIEGESATILDPTVDGTLTITNNASTANALLIAGGATLDGPLALTKVTIVDGDLTPDVSGGSFFVTSANTGAAAISDFGLPTVDQTFVICGGSDTNSSTIAHGVPFTNIGAATVSLSADSCHWYWARADNDYVEIANNDVASGTYDVAGGFLEDTVDGVVSVQAGDDFEVLDNDSICVGTGCDLDLSSDGDSVIGTLIDNTLDAMVLQSAGADGFFKMSTINGAEMLTLDRANSGVTPSALTNLFLESTDGPFLELGSINTEAAALIFSDPEGLAGLIIYSHANTNMLIQVEAQTITQLTSTTHTLLDSKLLCFGSGDDACATFGGTTLDWTLADNVVNSVSWSSAGAADILSVTTSDSAPKVSVTGIVGQVGLDVIGGVVTVAEDVSISGGTAAINLVHTDSSIRIPDNDSTALNIGSLGDDAMMAFSSLNSAAVVTFNSTISHAGADPVLSACGTTPTVVGGDSAGKVTIGTGVTTSCTATFAVAFIAAPSCIVIGDQTATTYAAATTTTVLTITSSADMDSDVINYHCIGL